jgi:hypothetical protein
MPSSLAMMRIGSRAAYISWTSPSPDAIIASMSSFASASTSSSSAPTVRGVNPRLNSLRKPVWSGGSLNSPAGDM